MALSVLNFLFTLLRYQVVLQLKLQLQLKKNDRKCLKCLMNCRVDLILPMGYNNKNNKKQKQKTKSKHSLEDCME